MQLFLHFVMPFDCLNGLVCLGGGSFALIKYSLIFFGLLYANRGALGIRLSNMGTVLTLHASVYAGMCQWVGVWGPKRPLQLVSLFFCVLTTFCNAISLGISLAFLIAPSIIPSL